METSFLCHTRPQLPFPLASTSAMAFPRSRKMDFSARKRRQARAAVVDEVVSLAEEEEEWRRAGKCRERENLVELLECLEREAIMGEDEGREPEDYHRKAKIFGKSGKVFHALKQTPQHRLMNSEWYLR